MYNEKGEKTWQMELDIYGKVRTFEGSCKTDCPFRYQGQYEDVETGLYYNRFRYYAPEEGLYLSQDPIGLAGGMNIYSYVKNPNIYVDTLGWWSELQPTGMGHHLFPRSIAKKLSIGELMQNNSIAWYPNNPQGTDALHGQLHNALSKEGLPYHGSKYTGTIEEAFTKMKNAYKDFNQKGFLKIPGTDEKLFRNLTPKEAIEKIEELYNNGKLKKCH